MSFVQSIGLSASAGQAYTGAVDYNQFQSDTDFGQMIVCAALYWFQQKLIQGNVNYNNMVAAYGSGEFDEKWCAVFPWWIINEVINALNAAFPDLNLKNIYPGDSKTYGNAVDTYNQANDIFGATGDLTQFSPGMVFYRKSTVSTASGHMGIIVRNDVANKMIYTIEGNVDYTGTDTYQVGMWVYSYDEATQYEMVAIYTTYPPNLNADQIQIIQYKGTNCEILVNNIATQDQTQQKTVINQCPEGAGWTSNYDANGNLVSCTPPTTMPDCLPPNVQDPTTGACCPPNSTYDKVRNACVGTVEFNYKAQVELTATQKKEKLQSSTCQSYINYTLPVGDQVLSWVNVSGNRIVAYDISTGDLGNKNPARNGAALGYVSDVGRPTGFGMFKDKTGNIIFALPHRIGQAKTLYDQKLMGGDWYEIVIESSDFFGGGWAERLGEFFAGYQRYPIKPLNGSYIPSNATANDKAIFNQLFNLESGVIEIGNATSPYLMYFNGFLKKLEQICANGNTKLSKPLVISISAQNPTQLAAEELLNFILIGAEVTASIVGIKIPPGIIKGTQTIIQAIQTGQLNFSEAFTIAASFAEIAQCLAPQTVTQIEHYFNDATKYIGNAIGNAMSAIGNSINGQFQIAGPFLGLNWQDVSNIYNGITNAGTDVINYLQITGKSFNATIKNIQNYKNILLPAFLNNYGRSSNFTGDLIQAGLSWNSNKYIRQIFIMAGTSGVLPTIPNINSMMAAMTKDPQALQTNIYNTQYKNGAEMHRGLVQNAFGYTPSKHTFDNILENALLQEANEYAKLKSVYVLPSGLDPDQAECYKYNFEQLTQNKVIACQDGFEFDVSLNKCVSLKTQVPVYKNGNYVCQDGYTYNPDTQLCESTSATTQVSKCPPGYTWNDAKQTCELNIIKKTESTITQTTNTNNTNNSQSNSSVNQNNNSNSSSSSNSSSQTDNKTTVNSKLPVCIVIVNNQYFYKRPPSVTATGTIPVVPQIINQQPSAINQLSIPVNGSIVSPSALPAKTNSVASLPVSIGTAPAPSATFTANTQAQTPISAPAKYVPPPLFPTANNPYIPTGITLRDIIIPDMTLAAYGTDGNWYVTYNNISYQIDPVTCSPIIPVVTTVPNPPPPSIVFKIPNCIASGVNGYVYNYNGKNYPAAVTNQGQSNEAWHMTYSDGISYPIINCVVNIPVTPPPPTPVIPPPPTPVIPPPPTPVIPPPPTPVIPPPPTPVIPPPVTPGTIAKQYILPKCISLDSNGNYQFSYETTHYKADVTAQGTVNEQWWVEYSDGLSYPLNDCVPDFPIPKPPPITPPAYKLPACISLDSNGQYVYAYQGTNLSASVINQKTSAEQWYVTWNNGQSYPLNNCQFTPPPPPPPSGGNTPPPTGGKKPPPDDCGCPKEVEEYKRTVFEYPPNQQDDCCDE